MSNVAVTLSSDQEERLSLIEWAMDRYYINGTSLSLTEHPYLIDILLEESPDQVVKKSAQVGVSEYLVMLSLYTAVERQKTVLYAFPTKGHIGDFVRQRVDPAIETSPYLSAIMKQKSSTWASRATGPQSASVMNVGLKRIGRGFIFFRGTKTKNDLISVPADLLIFDELDECVVANVPLAYERLAHSDLKWSRKVSTPWFPGGPIDRAYDESDGRVYLIHCGSCNTAQEIDWYRNIVQECDDENLPTYIPRQPLGRDTIKALAGPQWRAVLPSLLGQDLQAICEKCGSVMNRLSQGRWVAQRPGRSVVGWQVSRMNSPKKLLAELYKEFIAAQASINDLAIFHRMALGIGYDVMGDGLTKATLGIIAEDYDTKEVRGDFTTAGLDVGAKLHLKVSRNRDGVRVGVYKYAAKDFSEVARIIDRYRVDLIVVDALPETREAKRFRDSQPFGRVYLASFGKHCEGQAKSERDWLEIDHIAAHIKCDRTMVFDECTDAMVAEKPRSTFPKGWLEDMEWVEHMTSPRRFIVESKEGKSRAVWDEQGRPDHYRLSDIYDFLAARAIMNRETKTKPPVVRSEPEPVKKTKVEAEAGQAYPRVRNDEDAAILNRLLARRKKGA